MKAKTAIIALALLGMSTGTNAQPVLIPGSGGLANSEFLVDTDSNFTLRITSAAPVAGGANIFVNNFVPASPNWSVNLDISIQDIVGGDRVSIFGEVSHNFHPAGDPLAPGGVGDTFGFTFNFFPPAVPAIIPAAGVRAHDAHRDSYRLTSIVGLAPGNLTQINAWTATIRGTHQFRAVPEPSSLALLSAGLIILLSSACQGRFKF